jgi:hypothetical protein
VVEEGFKPVFQKGSVARFYQVGLINKGIHEGSNSQQREKPVGWEIIQINISEFGVPTKLLNLIRIEPNVPNLNL